MFGFQTGETLAIAKTRRLGQLHNIRDEENRCEHLRKSQLKMTIEA